MEASVSMVTTEEGEDDGVEVDEDPSKLVDKLSLIGKIVIDKQVGPYLGGDYCMHLALKHNHVLDMAINLVSKYIGFCFKYISKF